MSQKSRVLSCHFRNKCAIYIQTIGQLFPIMLQHMNACCFSTVHFRSLMYPWKRIVQLNIWRSNCPKYIRLPWPQSIVWHLLFLLTRFQILVCLKNTLFINKSLCFSYVYKHHNVCTHISFWFYRVEISKIINY